MKRLAVRAVCRYVCTYHNEPMCCVLEAAMPWCVVRLYCVRWARQIGI